MKNFLNVFIIFTMSFAAEASVDSGDFLDSLGGSWRDDLSKENKSLDELPVYDNKAPQSQKSKKINKVCTQKDQTSLPLKSLLRLMVNPKVSLNHDADTGLLKISSGNMIGNCNDMLQVKVSPPVSDDDTSYPYRVQLEIKRPAGCALDAKTCKYSAYTAENKIANDKEVEIDVRPDYYGFIECLEKTGVYEKGKINPKKVAYRKLYHEERGVNKTSSIVWASHGPEGELRGSVHGGKNLYPGDGCYFYEKVSKKGYKVYSAADTRRNNLANSYQKACSAGDYRTINQSLPDFTEFSDMYNSLVNIRNQRLKDEVQEVSDMLENESYEDLDPAYMRRVLEDFKREFIDPKTAELASLYIAPQNNATKAKMDKVSGELLKYASIFSKVDYSNMKDPRKKSPLGNEDWRMAALNVFALKNTAFHFGSYNKKFAKERKLKPKHPDRLVENINSDISVEREFMTKLGTLANNPDKSYSDEFLSEAEYLTGEIRNNNQYMQSFAAETPQLIQSTCFKYYRNSQRCQEDMWLDVEDEQLYIGDVNSQMEDEIMDYESNARQWAGIEAMFGRGSGEPARTARASRSERRAYAYNPDGATNGITSQRSARSNGSQYNFQQSQQYMDPRFQTQQIQRAGQYPGYQQQGQFNTSFQQRNPASYNTNMQYNSPFYAPSLQFNGGFNTGFR